NKSFAFDDYRGVPTAQLLATFVTGPARLRQAIAGLSEDELRARPRGNGTWSVHEIVLHVADSELQGAFRMRKVLAEPGAALPAFDQDRWAAALDYQGAGEAARAQALAFFAALRERTAPLLERATAAQWEQRGIHPHYGEVSLRNLLELYADHAERHVAQILDCRTKL